MRQGELIKSFTSKKGNRVVLRAPKQNDAQLLMDMINSVVAERDYILMIKKATLVDEIKVLKKWLAEIKSNKRVHVLAICDNKIIGGADVTRGTGARLHVGSFGIVLMDGYREEGIGSTMMKEAILLAKKVLGIRLLTLEVYDTNKRAQELYKKMGFTLLGSIPKAIKRRGKYIPEIIMYKEL